MKMRDGGRVDRWTTVGFLFQKLGGGDGNSLEKGLEVLVWVNVEEGFFPSCHMFVFGNRGDYQRISASCL